MLLWTTIVSQDRKSGQLHVLHVSQSIVKQFDFEAARQHITAEYPSLVYLYLDSPFCPCWPAFGTEAA